MPFLKLIEIVAPNGMKSAVSEKVFDPKKHVLWTAKDEARINETIEPEKVSKPVDLDFEPEFETSEAEEDSEIEPEIKSYSRKRKR